MPEVREVIQGEPVSSELAPLLQAVYNEIARQPPEPEQLRHRMQRLLSYLASPLGRTNANCWAADLFFCLDEGWDVGWAHLPEAFTDILGDMAGALHDSVNAPAVAENFDSTPEQLLARLHAIEMA